MSSQVIRGHQDKNATLIVTLNLHILVKTNRFYVWLGIYADDDSRVPLFLTNIGRT